MDCSRPKLPTNVLCVPSPYKLMALQASRLAGPFNEIRFLRMRSPNISLFVVLKRSNKIARGHVFADLLDIYDPKLTQSTHSNPSKTVHTRMASPDGKLTQSIRLAVI